MSVESLPVQGFLVDDEERQATVIVPDDQLSLAIGREGQNARLAANLDDAMLQSIAPRSVPSCSANWSRISTLSRWVWVSLWYSRPT